MARHGSSRTFAGPTIYRDAAVEGVPMGSFAHGHQVPMGSFVYGHTNVCMFLEDGELN